MNKIKIPKKFELGGRCYSVIHKNNLVDSTNCMGTSSSRTNKIVIQNNTNSVTMPLDNIHETWFHELVHALLDDCGEHDLSENESFVENFSRGMHQAFKTAVY